MPHARRAAAAFSPLPPVCSEWREQQLPHTAVTLEALSRTRAELHVLDALPGNLTLSTLAQLARLLAALELPFHPDDYLLVTDVDVWPLHPARFRPGVHPWVLGSRTLLEVHGGDCCGAKPVPPPPPRPRARAPTSPHGAGAGRVARGRSEGARGRRRAGP
jgi:hypothetical protein